MQELDRHEASDSDLDENVVSADIICLPPRDGDDTDKDDAASDEDVQTNNPRFPGRGVLAKPPELELHWADGDVHPSKQFIRGKPVRFGYKIWCLTTCTGYLVKYSPYTGKDGCQAGRGLGESVVENLAA